MVVFQVIFMLSLAILNELREGLVNAKDDGEAMTILSTYLESVTNKDATLPPVPHTAANKQKSKVIILTIF